MGTINVVKRGIGLSLALLCEWFRSHYERTMEIFVFLAFVCIQVQNNDKGKAIYRFRPFRTFLEQVPKSDLFQNQNVPHTKVARGCLRD